MQDLLEFLRPFLEAQLTLKFYEAIFLFTLLPSLLSVIAMLKVVFMLIRK